MVAVVTCILRQTSMMSLEYSLKRKLITGATSGATNLILDTSTSPADDGYADNDNFELEADAILDFSGLLSNPDFGTP